MEFFFVSFLAGVLTVLAPCVFPLLPVIIGGSATEKSIKRPLVIITSLSIFLVLITILLRFGEGFLDISNETLVTFSAVILIVFGLITLFPDVWGKISYKLQLSARSDQMLHRSSGKSGTLSEILTGIALGPVFTSCSPTYIVIIGLSFQAENQLSATIYLIGYVIGLASILMLIAIGGQKIISKLRWASNPNGLFKKFVGILFILIGLLVLFGGQKIFQKLVMDSPILENINNFEINLVQKTRP
ncbi:hypothetical protein KC669_01475 [Candidatus Dojkabacteria bacterium]|uniref:Cytochrome C biogenesis protein n=1 Tax=Candidatus Dojkabacteria bacterium TaxID=2099670 RepID=A0A955LAQ2_9BACT|nr:hypothetical protein [Candidatus Dojkabacteria bacterium]